MAVVIQESGVTGPVPVLVAVCPKRLPGRLRNRLARFEQEIAGFRQRRWA